MGDYCLNHPCCIILVALVVTAFFFVIIRTVFNLLAKGVSSFCKSRIIQFSLSISITVTITIKCFEMDICDLFRVPFTTGQTSMAQASSGQDLGGHSVDDDIFYDLKTEYSQDIRDDLTLEQVRLFDNILERERQRGGKKLRDWVVGRMARDDEVVIHAYERYRRYTNLMRSTTHTVYPSERAKYRF
jgi:hypothetical protein